MTQIEPSSSQNVKTECRQTFDRHTGAAWTNGVDGRMLPTAIRIDAQRIAIETLTAIGCAMQSTGLCFESTMHFYDKVVFLCIWVICGPSDGNGFRLCQLEREVH
jgi:hypothetical protein